MKGDLSSILREVDGCPPGEDHCRILHGRGATDPLLKPLTLDRYGSMVVALVHEEASWSVLELEEALRGRFSIGCVQDRSDRKKPRNTYWGCDGRGVACEGGLKYHLQFKGGQNLGFFPDMRGGRAWVRKRAAGKRVLNLFSYTCSLGVAAVAGEASSVLNVDLSSPSLAVGRENLKLNGLPLSAMEYLKGNVMKSWGRIARSGPFDVAVVDPPSFQRGSFRCEVDYPRVMRRLREVMAPDGRVLVALNSPHVEKETFASWLTLGNLYRLEEELPLDEEFRNEDSSSDLKVWDLGLA